MNQTNYKFQSTYRPKLFMLSGLIIILMLLRSLAAFPKNLEAFYSTGAYRSLSAALRSLTGKIPFSLGDAIYSLLLILCLFLLFRFFRQLLKSKGRRLHILLSGLLTGIIRLTSLYLIFQLCWGLNYLREPLAIRLSLPKEKANSKELQGLAAYLIDRINTSQVKLSGDTAKHYEPNRKSDELYHQASFAYQNSPSFNFPFPSIKTSWYKGLLNYAGIGGYYNPFTGEAQVNTDCPEFMQPFTICHEMAHQTGIAAEGEANFVGYLTALNAEDEYFRYSAELSAYLYTASALRHIDSTAHKKLYTHLNKGAKEDIKIYRAYQRKYQRGLTDFVQWYYDLFLKSNQQTQGINSYNQFVNLLLEYHRKQLIIEN